MPKERSMMWLRRPARRWAVVLAALAVPGVLAGGCGSTRAVSAGAGQAAAASCAAARGTWTAAEPANAWAAGYTSNGASSRSLILHWNGTAWTRAASPSPGAGGNLAGITASSSANAWAVGQFGAVGGDNA